MAKQANTKQDERRTKVSQSEFPNIPLSTALRIAQGLWDDFAGRDAAPHQVAMAIGMTPTSGTWRNLCGASIAFGLTTGGYNADRIELTELGKRIVAPQEEGDDLKALGEAIMHPRIMREFFQKYDKAKFPKDEIAQNVLVGFGLPKERAAQALAILKDAGERAGVIIDTKTGPFVALGTPVRRATNTINQDLGLGTGDDEDGGGETQAPAQPTKLHVVQPVHVASPPPQPTVKKDNTRRVFITHGRNQKILDHVKEIVTFGKFVPVVAKEVETVSKPVPQKVMDEMRSCDAAVIHVGIEGESTDENGKTFPRVNGNVLIEIGAAMALYRQNFILLVEEGAVLPSNLQGLYECRYRGDELSGEATMKLLKSFNDFKFEDGK